MAIFRLNDRIIVPTEKKFGYANAKIPPSYELDYISPQSASALNWSGGSGYNDTQGESDPCSGAVTFQEALQHAYDQGARLPTLQEAINNVADGTGCAYDFSMIWTCTKGSDATEHWVVMGKNGSGSEEVRANSATAYVRMVADQDIGRADPVELDDLVISDFLKGV